MDNSSKLWIFWNHILISWIKIKSFYNFTIETKNLIHKDRKEKGELIKKFWSQFPKLKMSDRSHLIPLERNDRAIHDPEWLGALIFRSSYEKKASLARGYLSAVQIGAPINVARSINPLSKGNVYSGNCVLRHGCTQPLVHPSPPRAVVERDSAFTQL